MRMTWKQCLSLCGLLLAADHFLYGDEPSKPISAVHRQVVGGKAFTPAEIVAEANRTDRELANVKPVHRMPPVSKAARAVYMAKSDPHPESVDWLTIITSK